MTRGNLFADAAPPADGEVFEQLARMGSVVIERIVSAERAPRTEYVQDHDEWVIVLRGAATLAVGGVEIELAVGDWVALPARVPHTVVRTADATLWLAIHVHPDRSDSSTDG